MLQFTRKQRISDYLAPKRALVIYGPRRVGKTTLLQAYMETLAREKPSARVFATTGDDLMVRELFRSEVRKDILDFARPFDVIAIDEAQSITRIGLGVKMIIDAFPEKTIILTGSSSFQLAAELGAPLTGRHFTVTLYPIAQGEMDASTFERKGSLQDILLYGTYPEVLLENIHAQKAKILTELISSYLFKDVLALDRIKSPDTLLDIVRCLAFQVGHEVSLHEIGTIVKVDTKTVGRYLDVLEKMFIIRKVRGFSRNLRNEIAKKAKYYFLDTGVRNAVIAQFQPLHLRNDVGALWENFIAMELVKQSALQGSTDAYFFWRTHTGQEIDIIKESNGTIAAFECKWSPEVVHAPPLWTQAYPDASFSVIHRENYTDMLLPGTPRI